MTDKTLCQKIGKFISRLRFEDLPLEVVNKARLCILDTIGCVFAASETDKGCLIGRYALERSKNGLCTVIGQDSKVVSDGAALANGTMAHMLEFDDGHRPSDNHIGCVVVPAALSMAEEEKVSGATFLLGAVAGYEVMGRVGEAVVFPRMESPFHGTGTCGPFGAAAAGGKMLQLDADQLANALGIAGTAAAGFREVTQSGWECKPLHAGRAAQNGIVASRLSLLRWEGPSTILEGKSGFCRAMTAEYDLEPLTDKLGSRWVVSDIGVKLYATCSPFTAIDAVLDLIREHKLKAKEIKAVKIGVGSKVFEQPAWLVVRPENSRAARFSTIYVVARAILDGEVTPRQFDEEKLRDPAVQALIDRIQIELDPEVDEIDLQMRHDPFFFPPASVEVMVADGKVLRKVVTNPRGYDPRKAPASQEEIVRKFFSLTQNILGEKRATAIAEAVLNLEKMPCISTLSNLLSG